MERGVLTVTDPAWASVLLDHREAAFYSPFVGCDCTVGAAARAGNVSLNTAFSRVRRLLRLGLLVVSGEQRRTGRAVKTYTMVAEWFFVPYEFTVHESCAALLLASCDLPSAHALSRTVARTRAQSAPEYGLELFRENGGLQICPATVPGVGADADPHDGPALFNMAVGDLMLNHSEAEALQRDLEELWQRYRHKGAEGRQHY
jgi:hypothetical protein